MVGVGTENPELTKSFATVAKDPQKILTIKSGMHAGRLLKRWSSYKRVAPEPELQTAAAAEHLVFYHPAIMRPKNQSHGLEG